MGFFHMPAQTCGVEQFTLSGDSFHCLYPNFDCYSYICCQGPGSIAYQICAR